MQVLRKLPDLLDWIWIGLFALFAGIVFGGAYGWWVGAGVGLGFIGLCVWVVAAAKALLAGTQRKP